MPKYEARSRTRKHPVSSLPPNFLANQPFKSHLFISLDKLAVPLIVLPFFDALVLFQIFILHSPVKLVVQQTLVLPLFQLHHVCHWIYSRYPPNVLLLTKIQILVAQKLVTSHKARETDGSTVKSNNKKN